MDCKIVIEGYCDECGMCEYNLVLGVCCVNVVCNYFISFGISVDRIEMIFYGKECFEVLGLIELVWM